MSTILGFIFIIIIIVLIFGLSIIGGILRLLFGTGKRRPQEHKQPYSNTGSSNGGTYNERESTQQASGNSRKKIFDKDEGEYVEFEEVTNEEKKK